MGYDHKFDGDAIRANRPLQRLQLDLRWLIPLRLAYLEERHVENLQPRLIEMVDRSAIQLTHRKQVSKRISNRNKNGTFHFSSPAAAFGRPVVIRCQLASRSSAVAHHSSILTHRSSVIHHFSVTHHSSLIPGIAHA